MVRSINPTFSDEDFNKIQEIKNRSGLSWDVFIIKAAEAYALNVLEGDGDND
jgi:hypothetical protein